MEFLDVPTVLQVSALFHLTAALAWWTLARAFRIAPRAGRLMAAAHLVGIASLLSAGTLADWPAPLRLGVPALGLLACALLAMLALRRMLRSRLRNRHVTLLAAASALGVLAGLASGSGVAPEFASTAGVTALAALATREVVRGLAGTLSPALTAGTALPFAVLAVLGLAHAAELLLVPGWHARALASTLPSAGRAVAGFVVTAGITLSLISLVVWRLISRIQHLTTRDPLTGTLNRRAFERALAEAQAQLQRGQGFALAMLDIDHFKRINDVHGHPAGDAALQHCVGLWQAELRAVDRLGRLGGEEFCALLPLAAVHDLGAAAAVAERLRARLAAQPLHWDGRELRLTTSVGVALPVAGDADGEVGLARADAALYRAKALGRNRVCMAEVHTGAAPA